jgi:hypothetical protein
MLCVTSRANILPIGAVPQPPPVGLLGYHEYMPCAWLCIVANVGQIVVLPRPSFDVVLTISFHWRDLYFIKRQPFRDHHLHMRH